ncbi:MAG: nucleotidyltransferase domain-containing protein [Candidatus Odinarchaeum yellowstonii]|uniref:Nucleotidyltransferase domain-containing protein n=1 Tax=Odinarchaeota yellowstonii (strain LCB_4) TaxID=1841599 RepID=A0AAF0IBY4_ODILC|nr:MAG: nucleotidyltransferase domain-containing protein [Candidatus Odinarchaeum yellowstonii]
MDITLLKKISQKIGGETDSIDHIILFGSVAEGKEDVMSDVDLAFFLKGDYTLPDVIFELEDKFRKNLNYKFDIIILNQVGSALKYDIYTKGLALYYKNKDTFDEAYVRAVNEFLDFQYIFEQYYQKAYDYIVGDLTD